MTDRIKLALATILLAAATLGAVGLLVSATGLQRAVLSGASPADVFTPVTQIPSGLDPVLAWRPDRPTPRPMEPATRALLEEAWVGAFARLDVALRDGDPADLPTSFSGDALDQVLATVADSSAGQRQVPLAHELELTFYADDGSVVGLTDHGMRLVRQHGATTVEATEAWQAVLLLHDGRWRVQHLVRTGPVGESSGIPSPADGREALAWDGANIVLPGTTWFDGMVVAGDDVMAADLDAAAALGMDTVRVFLPYADLGGAAPDPAAVDRFRSFLDLAGQRGVGVVPTLFDGWTERDVTTWADADRHLAGVVGAVAGHPALAAWDLKNEPDLDDEREGRDAVRAWLRHVAGEVARLDPGTPRTIGWSSAGAVDLVDVVEVASFHHLGNPEDLAAALPALLDRTGDLPVVLSEYGVSSWDGWLPGGHTEADQARHAEAIRRVAAEHGLSGTLAWVLRDPAHLPPGAGRSPLARGAEANFGLLHADGRPKLAALLFGPEGTPAPPRGPVLGLVDRRVEQAAAALLVPALAVGGVGLRSARGRRA